MGKRSLPVLRAVVVIGVVAAIAGAATPGHAKGISYQSLNKIQKRLISGGLAMSLTRATPTSQAADAETCGNQDPQGRRARRGAVVSARQLHTRPALAVAQEAPRATRPPETAAVL